MNLQASSQTTSVTAQLLLTWSIWTSLSCLKTFHLSPPSTELYCQNMNTRRSEGWSFFTWRKWIYLFKQTKVKKDHFQTLIRDLMLLNLKDLLGSSDRWKVLVGFWVARSGLCTSTTWPLWHRMTRLLSFCIKTYKKQRYANLSQRPFTFTAAMIKHWAYVRMRWPLQRLYQPRDVDKTDGVVVLSNSEEEHSAVSTLRRKIRIRRDIRKIQQTPKLTLDW